MRKLLVFLAVMGMTGCGIGMKITAHKQRSAIAAYEPFAVVEENEPFDTARAVLVAELRTTDKGFTMRCDYPAVLDTVTRMARSLGANIVKIDKHVLPSTYGGTCHRVEARLYRVDDATPFEESITWSPERRLVVADFRGDTAQRPFQAVTACSITYHGNYFAGRVVVVVEALFDHDGSYFKKGDDDMYVLAHEQIHFDIAELYTRILRKRISETSFAGPDLSTRLEELQMTVMRELAVEQDRYDADVYPDPSRQSHWSSSITSRLQELEMYRSRKVVLSTR